MAARPPVRIRDATPDDRDIVVEFNSRLATESEGKELDPDVLHAGVEIALKDPERLRYWLAEADGRIVGQAAVTREWSDWRNGWIWWFQSVYVHPDHRRQGVFRAIHNHIRETARNDPGVLGLRLYVEKENSRAAATYADLGMDHAGYEVYEELWPERFKPGHPRS